MPPQLAIGQGSDQRQEIVPGQAGGVEFAPVEGLRTGLRIATVAIERAARGTGPAIGAGRGDRSGLAVAGGSGEGKAKHRRGKGNGTGNGKDQRPPVMT